MDLPVIPYGKQNITEEDILEVANVLRSGYLTQGPKVEEFEAAFADYVGSQYAVAVSNGTAALHLSTLALGVAPGQKVITTPITFAATANSVLYAGGDVQFCDIDPKTYCLDLNRVEEALKRDTAISGIIPVDFAGLPVQIDSFRNLAEKYGVWILEDACHAPGASITDQSGVKQKVGNGNFADLTIFSFHPVKHIACGEGGMVTTNDHKLFEKLKTLRTHGITKEPSRMMSNDGGWYYEMQELGFNYRLSDILCALGTSQLSRASQALSRRQEIANRYNLELADLPLELPQVSEGAVHAYHLYVILTERRKELYEFLKAQNIFCQVHYLPVYRHPYYSIRYGSQSFPVSEDYYEKCLSLPMFHSLTDGEQGRVISAVRSFYDSEK